MKKLISILVVMVALVGCTNVKSNDEDSTLRFRDGKFRIAQFTDIHWVHGDTVNANKKEMILNAVGTEKPDLCILTGDIVTEGDGKEGWRDVASMMEETGVPYVILMGNHDPERWERDSIYGFLKQNAPHHLGNTCLSPLAERWSGVVKVLSERSDSTALVLYCIDSGDYYSNPLLSCYDNIHLEQIRWYADKSTCLRKENGGEPLPALAFFHICVPEYGDLTTPKKKYYGHFCESMCPSEINSGFFSAVLEQGDVMGMFVGHDHLNDYIGVLRGVALAYGRQSGVMGDNEPTPKGCRIIELREGSRAFDTWIWTPERGEELMFYYPTAVTPEMEEGPSLDAQDVDASELESGIGYTFIAGTDKETTIDAMISRGEVKDTGVMPSIDITQSPIEDHFGYVFDGYFLAEKKGVYIFSMMSDDGSRLFIDGECIIDLDGSHAATFGEGYVALEKGYHKICVQYFEDYMGQQLDVWLTTRDSPRQTLPENLLYVKKGGK